MFKWLKNHFVPHHGNGHRPHFLRVDNVQAILIVVLALELFGYVLPSIMFTNFVGNTNLASVLPGVLASLTNNERQDNNLPALSVSPLLTQAAELKAQDMAEKSYFAHTSPEGKTPWYWLDQVGYQYDYAGENLAINFSDSEDVTDAWMNSPTHRANIVKTAYTEVGTGIATGQYEGRETIFVAQVYANPRSQPLAMSQIKGEPEATVTLPVETPVEISVETPTETALETTTEETEILGASVSETSVATSSGKSPLSDRNIVDPELQAEPNSFEKAIASPRHTATSILFLIFGIVVLALIINILVKVNIQHPDLITNGLFLVVVIGAVLTINNFVGPKDILISQGVDYSLEQTVDQEQGG